MQDYDLRSLFDRYVRHGEVMRNYSKTTLTNYKSSFRVFLKDMKVESLDDFNEMVLEDFFCRGRIERGWNPQTFRHYHKHLNTFAKWLIKRELIEVNPLDGLEKPRMENKLPRTLNKDQAKKVLDASFHMRYRYKYEKYRNRAMIGLMLFAGLRKGEVFNLKVNHVDLENRTIFIEQGKGKKDRLIPMNHQLQKILQEHDKYREKLYADCVDLFLAIGKHKPFGVKGMTNLIVKLKKKTKLDFSAHTLRHSFATLMLEGGCDIYTLSKIMGHSKITTTTIYLQCTQAQMSKCIEMHSLC